MYNSPKMNFIDTLQKASLNVARLVSERNGRKLFVPPNYRGLTTVSSDSDRFDGSCGQAAGC